MPRTFIRTVVLIIVVTAILVSIALLEARRVPSRENVVRRATIPLSSDRLGVSDKTKKYERAKELVDTQGQVNASDLRIADLIGKKVILVDFWTYTCINCQRTQPYLNAWYEKYKDAGLEIVGVHTPEFEFEKKLENVKRAVASADIEYPVVQDNVSSTFIAYGARAWPTKFLIDIDGFVIYSHRGEGGYDEIEAIIQRLLTERANVLADSARVPSGMVSVVGAEEYQAQSPETYFGSSRNEYLGNGKPFIAGTSTFVVPDRLEANKLYLGGEWIIGLEQAESVTEASIRYRYNARRLFFVGRASQPVRVRILLDGEPIGIRSGADVLNGIMTVQEDRLYDIVKDSEAGEHELEMQILDSGLEAYTFTFG